MNSAHLLCRKFHLEAMKIYIHVIFVIFHNIIVLTTANPASIVKAKNAAT